MRESRTFNNTGEDFSGYNAAVDFLKERGFSVGEMQTGSPTGVYFGECKIGKYRSLDSEEKSDLHGIIQAKNFNFRKEHVEVVIRGNVKSDVMDAFRGKPYAETMPIVGLDDSATDTGMTIDAEDVQARLHVEHFVPDQRLMVDP
jgi:hypothetical protein